MLLQLKPLQFLLILIHANPPSQWCHEYQVEREAYGSSPQVSKYFLWLKSKPLESDLTLFFSDPKSDPYSNHILPSSMLEHLVQSHDLSPGLPQEPNNWSPGSCPILNSLFSAWQPQRIFQNARQIISTAPCSKSVVSYLRVKVKVLLMACKGPTWSGRTRWHPLILFPSLRALQ